jgi:hypothetical protein
MVVLVRSPMGAGVCDPGGLTSRFRLAACWDTVPRLSTVTGYRGLVLPLGDAFEGDRKRNFFFPVEEQLLGDRCGDGGGEAGYRSATEVGEGGACRELRRCCIVPRFVVGSRLSCLIVLRAGESLVTSMVCRQRSQGRCLMFRK